MDKNQLCQVFANLLKNGVIPKVREMRVRFKNSIESLDLKEILAGRLDFFKIQAERVHISLCPEAEKGDFRVKVDRGDKLMKNFSDILNKARDMGKRRLAVAQAADATVLAAVEDARREGIIEAILVGFPEEIKREAEKAGVDLKHYMVIEPESRNSVAGDTVKQVVSGEAELLMKGLIPTGELLKEVLAKENGLNRGRTLSHVGIFEHSDFERLLFVTDAGLNIAPDLKKKRDIVQNAIDLAAGGLGIHDPIVAILAAVELVNPDMVATLDGASLTKMAQRGSISGGRVEGPLALDNAISVKAAQHKGIISPLAGRADILVVPDIEAGNVLYKSLVLFGKAKSAGIIVGARVPVVLASRADSTASKLNSIALAVLAGRG